VHADLGALIIAGGRACSTSTRLTHPVITNETSPHFAETLAGTTARSGGRRDPEKDNPGLAGWSHSGLRPGAKTALAECPQLCRVWR
jgi:hypothetical protein